MSRRDRRHALGHRADHRPRRGADRRRPAAAAHPRRRATSTARSTACSTSPARSPRNTANIPQLAGDRARARADRRGGRRPGRLHERAHRRLRRCGMSTTTLVLLSVLLAVVVVAVLARRADRGPPRACTSISPGPRHAGRRARDASRPSTCARSSRAVKAINAQFDIILGALPGHRRARPRSWPRGGRDDPLVDRRHRAAARRRAGRRLPAQRRARRGAAAIVPSVDAHRDAAARPARRTSTPSPLLLTTQDQVKQTVENVADYGGSLDVILDDARGGAAMPAAGVVLIITVVADRARARLLPRLDDRRPAPDHDGPRRGDRRGRRDHREDRAGRRGRRRHQRATSTPRVDALEGLLVKKAGHGGRRRPRRRPYPGAAAQGFRNFPESATIKAPRIAEVYTQGHAHARPPRPRGADRRRQPAGGPVLRNVHRRQPRGARAVPRGRQTRPEQLPRSPVIGTDAPVQYEPSEEPASAAAHDGGSRADPSAV